MMSGTKPSGSGSEELRLCTSANDSSLLAHDVAWETAVVRSSLIGQRLESACLSLVKRTGFSTL